MKTGHIFMKTTILFGIFLVLVVRPIISSFLNNLIRIARKMVKMQNNL